MVFPIAGGTQDTGYEISNSLRFNSASSSYLSFTTSTPTSQRIATWSFWMKKANDATQVIFGSSGDYMEIYNESDGELWFYMSDSNSDFLKSTALHRDQSAWYHIVMVLDTTQGTEANRAKMFVNGTQLTSFISANYPSQNDDLTGLAASKNFHIGARAYGGAASYLDAYIADFNFVDGSALDPTYFGETNDNGVWIPKKPDVSSYGNNGFFLEFKQTGTSANSSGMGADTSGNDNHFASNNLASDHVTTDTPTNNFCTLNPLAKGSSVTLSEGNLKYVPAETKGTVGTFGLTKGKWYWEIKAVDVGSNTQIGLYDGTDGNGFPTSYLGVNSSSWGVISNDGNTIHNGSQASYGSSFSDNDILQVALDMDNGKWYVGKNGTYFNSGNPATSTNPAHTGIDTGTGTIFPSISNNNTTGVDYQFNFGNAPFSISSGNADANGYGNFEYAVPSGYYALNTKNLAEFG